MGVSAKEPDPEATADEPATTDPRARMALRRWRLWWRFQLRVLPRRGPLHRARLLRKPDEDAPFRGQQLAVGRLLGRGYLGLISAREKARIERARVPERVRPLRTVLELLGRQRALLAGLLGLIVMGAGLDVLLRELGPHVVHALGVEGWLRSTFTRPSAETLRIVLAAAAGGTATILGLVLSISLISWQATADRYRSTSIVAFLLRERLGSAVVRLLALGFAYSLWVLALFEISGHRPYASTALAVGLCTAAVLSLISYRESALIGYLPVSIAHSLKEEIIAELDRARRRGAGRSVENRSRIIIAADLQIFRGSDRAPARRGRPDRSHGVPRRVGAGPLLPRNRQALDRTGQHGLPAAQGPPRSRRIQH